MNDVAVWVNEDRCKSCDICVSYCPAGVLAMREEASKVAGTIIEVVYPQSCIGCRDCELHCPDFAIYVADKGFQFAKLTPEAKQRAIRVKENKYRKLKDEL